jgi:hypothetical protein
MKRWFLHPSLFAIGLTLASCGILDPDRQVNGLDEAKARWALLAIDDYEIVIERLCFCPDVTPVRVTVVGGNVVSRVYLDSGEPVPQERAASYPAVPGLFDLLDEANHRGASINVTFDQQYGFPTAAFIDYIKNAIDDEVSIRTSSFDLIAAPQS